ncbi:hypothetical protein [Amycolatopsis rifamycinica]|uniref:Lipoprotein n=1 Tax=Amycolatopsis rifamycinica TaxID=287986 RepID=A0A066TV76_9PSEU|nr:hypothetical protein [Amycolatopsis rifamycinica]KDN18735.1 hypothetical protein DV20_29535 [Amycolatopsis rifamycinica]
MNLFRPRRVIAVLALGVAGCATPAVPDAPSGTGPTTATTTETTPTAPGAEPSGPERPRTGDHEVAISIPELPIGGNADPAGTGKLCATASWLQPDALPDGGVTVTRIWADPPDGFRVGGSCGGLRGCASYRFRPGGGRCSVAVTGPGTAEGAQLKFAGRFSCTPGRESSCHELTRRVNPGSIGLSRPETTTEPEPTATPAATPTG